MTKGTCSVEDCERPHAEHGFCKMHASRWRRFGDTDLHPLLPSPPSLEELAWRILRRVKITASGCWEFQGSRTKLGYGQIQTSQRSASGARTPRQTHRVLYEFLVGPVPYPLVLDHFACDNPPCCNPEHLKPVTRRENNLRGTSPPARHAVATHCINGHAFNAQNTGRTARGSRYCRRCKADCQMRRYYAKKAEAERA